MPFSPLKFLSTLGKSTTWKALSLRYREFCILFLARLPLIFVHENISFQKRNKEIWSRKEKTSPCFLHILHWNQLRVTDNFHLCKRQQHFSSAHISVTWDVTAVLLNTGIKSSFLQNLKPGYATVVQLYLYAWEKTELYNDKDKKNKATVHHMETQQLILMWCYYFHGTIIPNQCLLATPRVWMGLW